MVLSRLVRTTSLGRRLKSPVRRALAAAGYELVPLADDANTYTARLLDRLGVRTVLDVGANQGQYGGWLRRIGYEGQIVSCEPMTQPFQLLCQLSRGDTRWQALQVAAGEAEATLVMHVSANSVSSSLLAPTAGQVAAAPESVQVREESVRVRRLDDVVAELDLVGPLWLKIDTQGFEQQVLAGAPHVLASAVGVQCEVSLSELYEGQADYLGIVGFLRDAGLSLVRVEPAFVEPTTGDALQLDVVMIRR